MTEGQTVDIRHLQIAAGYGKRFQESPMRNGAYELKDVLVTFELNSTLEKKNEN